jgi:NAD(P)-dependent dehydrogenase (short-subunit alcohol dehydrogenase family)
VVEWFRKLGLSVGAIWLRWNSRGEEQMAEHFQGKVAIVTGGASGIGKALCKTLCHYGAHVIAADIHFERAHQLSSALSANGGSARAARLDVTNFQNVKSLVSEITSEHGQLDYMFNNAAATATRGELFDLPLEVWQRALDVNLLGVVNGTIAAYSPMKHQGFGHIVNTSSIAGLIGYPSNIAYSATKSAVVNLSVSFRIEAEDAGVNVSVVCPGPIHGEVKHPVRLIGVDRAAQIILNGVKQNRAIIVFPILARILWGLYRLSPRLLFPIGRKLVKDFRNEHRSLKKFQLQQW